jgi:hypothetical protein
VPQDTATITVPSGGFSGWIDVTMDFTATAVDETLSFLPGGSGNPPFVLLDSVSLTAVPEPSTWAMMLLGFGGLGVVARLRRRRAAAAA